MLWPVHFITMNTLNELIRSLNHNSTRDLAWAIFFPHLLQHHAVTTLSPELNCQRINWIKDLDKAPEALEHELFRGASLGRYYESLWAFFFKYDTQYQVIAQNLAIQDESRTIGEFDFIIRDSHSDCFIHHEVAVKYYLYFQRHNLSVATDKHNWLGPNSRDTLHKKWTHITQHQSQLGEHPSAKAELSKLGIEKLQKTIALKGYLFSSQNKKSSLHNTPSDFNNKNTLSLWFSIEDFLLWSNEYQTLAFIPKKQWLGSNHELNSIELLNKESLTNKVRKANTPLMAAYVLEEESCLTEEMRFFVIPDKWPANWPYSKL